MPSRSAANTAAEGADVAQNGGTYSAVHHFSAAKRSRNYDFPRVALGGRITAW